MLEVGAALRESFNCLIIDFGRLFIEVSDDCEMLQTGVHCLRQFHYCFATNLGAIFKSEVLDRPMCLAKVFDAVKRDVVLEFKRFAAQLKAT